MKTFNKWTISVPAMLLVLLVSVLGLAQEGPNGEYSEPLQPGLHISVDAQTSGSALAQAARERKSIVISGQSKVHAPTRQPGRANYIVKEGDTLYEICQSIWGDPYLWPRLWALNPKITNPHWIYPGDTLRLTAQAGASGETSQVARSMELPAIAASSSNLELGVVMLRNRGFVDKEVLKQSGELVGAHKNVFMLGQFDEAYVEFGDDAQVSAGANYVVFKIVGPVKGIDDPDSEVGSLVEIIGDVKVLSFDSETKIARVYIEESMRPIERGDLIGPVYRKFDLTPAVANQETLKGQVIAFMDPGQMAAEHHVVFVNLGTEHGVREGNRIFAVEAGDRYRESKDEKDDREGFPTEVIAEMRVVEARPYTATCLITASVRELAMGQKVEMRAGY